MPMISSLIETDTVCAGCSSKPSRFMIVIGVELQITNQVA